MRTIVWTLVVLISYGCGDDGGGGGDAGPPPGPDRRTATITPESGGTLTSADGRLVITFPPGAVSSTKELFVEPAEEPRAYRLGPDGEEFAAPAAAVMTFPLADVQTGAATPVLMLMSESSRHGTEPLTARADLDGQPLDPPRALMVIEGGTVRLAGHLSHFSKLQVKEHQGFVTVYETNMKAQERVGDRWQATMSVQNLSVPDLAVSRVDQHMALCGPAKIVSRAGSCGTTSGDCCQRFDGPLLGASGGAAPPGTSVTLTMPAEAECIAHGMSQPRLILYLTGLGEGYAAEFSIVWMETVQCIAAECGNGMLDTGEECDGMVFPGGNANCPSPSYDAGMLSCTQACTLDRSDCTRCGDGTQGGPEACDLSDLDGKTCTSLGFPGGTLACNSNCTFNTNGCTNMMCGNQIIEGSESCDGANLGGATCMSVNSAFNGGTLSCSGNCMFNMTACKRCGDGMKNLPESCDGADLGGASCMTLGYASGMLQCRQDCSFNFSDCSYCGNNVIDNGELCDGTEFGGKTCQDYNFTGGVLTCTPTCGIATADCTQCGDNLAEGTEICDGTDLPAGSCANLGFNAGTLACDSTCNYTGCFNMGTCGNGIVETGETCDDANTGTSDGCANCRVQGGYTCTGSPSVCMITCGNGVLDGNETCEDGQREAGDGCSTSCTPEPGFTCTGVGQGSCTTMCGDGVARGFEICDDGNQNNSDGCTTSCRIPGAQSETEPNDDGTPSSGNDFSAAAANGPYDVGSAAADIVIEGRIYGPSGQAGDDDVFAVRNTSGATRTVRFDTFSGASGLNNPCSSVSQSNTRLQIRNSSGTVVRQNDDRSGSDRCGGIAYDIAPGETVYAQVTHSFESDLIPAYMLRIQAASCGDSTVQFGEECEPPNTLTCDASCQRIQRCSDGFVDEPEQCDDSNMTNNDGCSSTCQWEATTESEPNDDGAVATSTNDFAAMAADGPLFATGMFDAIISPAGDDDVFAIANPTMAAITVRADVWNQFYGVGKSCQSLTDLRMVVRDALGNELQQNNDRDGSFDRCPGLDIPLAPMQTKYVHLTEVNDLFEPFGRYWLRVVYP